MALKFAALAAAVGLAAGGLTVGMTALPAGSAHAADPKPGGSLVIRMNSDIRGTDGFNRDSNTDTILHHIFESLVGYRADLTVGPALADPWEISDDGKTYTFTLRDGAPFHDGTPVTAADVKRSWEWRMNPEKEWRCASAFDGSQGIEVVSVEPVDDGTVAFTLAEPSGLFLMQMANFQCNNWVASEKNFDADGNWIADSAIGTGPFTLKDWRKGESITLAKYGDYTPLPEPASGYAGDRTAYVDEVKFQIIPDTAVAETALYAGEVDILPGLDGQKIEEAKGNGIKVLTSEGLQWTPILFQTRDELMSDPKFRKAIAHAVDINQIADARTGGLVKGNPSVVGRAMAFFDEDFLVWPEYDPAKTKALLEEIGYDGAPLKIQTNTKYQGMYENSVLLQAMLAAAGINAELEVLDWGAQLDNYLSGDFQVQSFGYSARLDPSLMYGKLIGNKDDSATRQWENDEAYELYLKTLKTTDFEERKALFKKIHALMAEDVPILGLYFEPVVEAVQPEVEGYEAWAGDKTRAWGVWLND